jgi:hypothetical protein
MSLVSKYNPKEVKSRYDKMMMSLRTDPKLTTSGYSLIEEAAILRKFKEKLDSGRDYNDALSSITGYDQWIIRRQGVNGIKRFIESKLCEMSNTLGKKPRKKLTQRNLDYLQKVDLKSKMNNWVSGNCSSDGLPTASVRSAILTGSRISLLSNANSYEECSEIIDTLNPIMHMKLNKSKVSILMVDELDEVDKLVIDVGSKALNHLDNLDSMNDDESLNRATCLGMAVQSKYDDLFDGNKMTTNMNKISEYLDTLEDARKEICFNEVESLKKYNENGDMDEIINKYKEPEMIDKELDNLIWGGNSIDKTASSEFKKAIEEYMVKANNIVDDIKNLIPENIRTGVLEGNDKGKNPIYDNIEATEDSFIFKNPDSMNCFPDSNIFLTSKKFSFEEERLNHINNEIFMNSTPGTIDMSCMIQDPIYEDENDIRTDKCVITWEKMKIMILDNFGVSNFDPNYRSIPTEKWRLLIHTLKCASTLFQVKFKTLYKTDKKKAKHLAKASKRLINKLIDGKTILITTLDRMNVKSAWRSLFRDFVNQKSFYTIPEEPNRYAEIDDIEKMERIYQRDLEKWLLINRNLETEIKNKEKNEEKIKKLKISIEQTKKQIENVNEIKRYFLACILEKKNNKLKELSLLRFNTEIPSKPKRISDLKQIVESEDWSDWNTKMKTYNKKELTDLGWYHPKYRLSENEFKEKLLSLDILQPRIITDNKEVEITYSFNKYFKLYLNSKDHGDAEFDIKVKAIFSRPNSLNNLNCLIDDTFTYIMADEKNMLGRKCLSRVDKHNFLDRSFLLNCACSSICYGYIGKSEFPVRKIYRERLVDIFSELLGCQLKHSYHFRNTTGNYISVCD